MEEKTALKAAKWWADQLRSPAKLDNGDESLSGAMTFALATMLQESERKGLQNDKIDAFEKELAIMLQTKGDKFILGVDYHPDKILHDAGTAAGLDLGMTGLPWKTVMWIDNNTVTVKCGYGAQIEEI